MKENQMNKNETPKTVQTTNIPAVVQKRPVRLFDAMVAWNPAWSICPRGGEPGQVGVCKHPDNGQLRHLSMWVKPSSHAENCPYNKKDMATMLKLMIEAWHIACRDGVPLANIHAALSSIPEYNEMLAEDFEIFLPNSQTNKQKSDL